MPPKGMNKLENTIFDYWGKADPNYPGEKKWHPLVYHSLDIKVYQ